MANNDFYIPTAPTNDWKVGDIARATSTGEKRPVVAVLWDEIAFMCDGRRLRFPVHFVEKVENETKNSDI